MPAAIGYSSALAAIHAVVLLKKIVAQFPADSPDVPLKLDVPRT
jgi:hypothetical protein